MFTRLASPDVWAAEYPEEGERQKVGELSGAYVHVPSTFVSCRKGRNRETCVHHHHITAGRIPRQSDPITGRAVVNNFTVLIIFSRKVGSASRAVSEKLIPTEVSPSILKRR